VFTLEFFVFSVCPHCEIHEDEAVVAGPVDLQFREMIFFYINWSIKEATPFFKTSSQCKPTENGEFALGILVCFSVMSSL